MDNKPSSKISAAGAWPKALRPLIGGQADHHIKVHLQQVANLLQLQATDDGVTRPNDALMDAAARIKAVAHWHGFLSRAQAGGRRTVALDGYLNAFADHFVEVFAAPARIVLLVNADPIRVAPHVAGMLGQIVNELVINAARHAFGPKRLGTIQVECGRDADGRIVLQVSDDRTGYLNGYGLNAPGAFGMQIVTALAKQLGGTLVVPKPGASTCHRVTIPVRRRSSAGRKRKPPRK